MIIFALYLFIGMVVCGVYAASTQDEKDELGITLIVHLMVVLIWPFAVGAAIYNTLDKTCGGE